MKKLKPDFYWAKHPCTKKFLVGEGFWFGLSTVGWGIRNYRQEEVSRLERGEVNMKPA
jgi:hypothetical protein